MTAYVLIGDRVGDDATALRTTAPCTIGPFEDVNPPLGTPTTVPRTTGADIERGRRLANRPAYPQTKNKWELPPSTGAAKTPARASARRLAVAQR